MWEASRACVAGMEGGGLVEREEVRVFRRGGREERVGRRGMGSVWGGGAILGGEVGYRSWSGAGIVGEALDEVVQVDVGCG